MLNNFVNVALFSASTVVGSFLAFGLPKFNDYRLFVDSQQPILFLQEGRQARIADPPYPNDRNNGFLIVEWPLVKTRSCPGFGTAWAVSLTRNYRRAIDTFATSAPASEGVYMFDYNVSTLPVDCYRLEAQVNYDCGSKYLNENRIEGPRFCIDSTGLITENVVENVSR